MREDELYALDTPQAPKLWVIFRGVVAMFAVVAGAMGGLAFAVFWHYLGWWLFGLGFACSAFAMWLLWAAIWGSRRLIDCLVTHVLGELVGQVFARLF